MKIRCFLQLLIYFIPIWLIGGVTHSQEISQPQTFVYECQSGESFIVNLKDKSAWVFLPRKTVQLPQVPSESGAKFSDGSMTYWSEGEVAILEGTNKKYHNCRNNRSKAVWEDAKLRGVDFRTVGNEPGWYLEISNRNQILFVTNYGQTRHEFFAEPPVTNKTSRTTIYTAIRDQQLITVTIEGHECHDTMSGQSSAVTVEVVFDGKNYRGCGRALH